MSSSELCEKERNPSAEMPPSVPVLNGGTTLVPELAKVGVTFDDLAAAVKVLNAVASLDTKKKKSKDKKKRKRSDGGNNNKEGGDDTAADANVDRVMGTDENEKGGDDKADEELVDGLALYKQPNLREFRKSLSSCLSLHQRTMFDGKGKNDYYADRMVNQTLKRQKMAERGQQKKYIAATQLRRGRVDKLNKLKEDSKEEEEMKLLEFMVPDGHVDIHEVRSTLLLEDGKQENEEGSQIVSAEGSNGAAETETPTVLPKLRACYVCKVRFRVLHKFYDQLCPNCAPLNYEKRHQSADMTNAVAVVTGSRVKIGFQVCLKLLRAGATVVATTRFPNNAAEAYRRERDFGEWCHRLNIYGLDLRDITGLEAFTRYLKITYAERGIDVLINNACQTVRRPVGYYLPLMEQEGEIWKKGDDRHFKLLSGCVDFENVRRRLVVEHSKSGSIDNGTNLLPASEPDKLMLNNGEAKTDIGGATDSKTEEPPRKELVTKNHHQSTSPTPFETTGISHSAAMSQMVIIPDDVGVDEKVMPAGLKDINGQQLDLRTTNSWLLKMDQVSTPEVMECMFVNAIAPFVLNSRLQPLMESPAGDPTRPDRYIINVSAMEGKFYRYKMPNHPHTNMAKAAMNMLTRTSAEDLAKRSRIFMNSVDTGWINDENPLEKASKIAKTNLFQTPIDEIDAAARILDPVFVGINMDEANAKAEVEGKTKKDYGVFFKDYKESEW